MRVAATNVPPNVIEINRNILQHLDSITEQSRSSQWSFQGLGRKSTPFATLGPVRPSDQEEKLRIYLRIFMRRLRIEARSLLDPVTALDGSLKASLAIQDRFEALAAGALNGPSTYTLSDVFVRIEESLSFESDNLLLREPLESYEAKCAKAERLVQRLRNADITFKSIDGRISTNLRAVLQKYPLETIRNMMNGIIERLEQLQITGQDSRVDAVMKMGARQWRDAQAWLARLRAS